MSDKTKAALEELKELRLALFRCAASLDDSIRDAEMFANRRTEGIEYNKMSIKVTENYRNSVIQAFEFDKILEKEKEVWQKLIDSLE